MTDRERSNGRSDIRAPACPDPGTWRAWIDGEHPGRLEEHLANCDPCGALVRSLRADAVHAASALSVLAPDTLPSPASMTLARARLAAATSHTVTQPENPGQTSWRPTSATSAPSTDRKESLNMLVSRVTTGWRLAAAGLAAALLVGIVATVPEAQSAAAGFLAQFRSQRFVAVPVDPQARENPFARLKDFGTVEEPRQRRPERVASLDEAARRVGIPLKQPDAGSLPAGLAATPTYQVYSGTELRFTFEKARVEEYLRRIGRTDVAVPDRFDGTKLVVSLPPAAMIRYRDATRDASMLVGQSPELTAGVEGNATLEELRDYLLGLPGLPPETVQQLRAIQDWRNTLPIPVPVDRMTWQDTTVAGAPALMLADPTGLGAGVIWQQDGRIYGVAGNFHSQEVLRVANGLR